MTEPASDSEHMVPRRDVSKREPVFNMPAVVVALIALCTAIFLIQAYVLTDDQYVGLLLRGAFIPERYDYPLDVWGFTSTFTYSLLHGGWSHLIVNMIWLAAFGSPLANRLGVWRFLLFWLVTTWGAVALHFALHVGEQVPLVGASGAISGMMGAAARFGFRIDRSMGLARFSGRPLSVVDSLTSRTVLTFLIVWMVVNFVAGMGYLTPQDMGAIAWEAHVGGFLVGFLGIGLFGSRRPAAPIGA